MTKLQIARYGWMVLLCLSISFSYAQEQLGLRMENHAGITGITLNPAAPATSNFKWQFNIGSGGVFMDNNFGYLEKTSLFHLLRNTDNVVSAIDNQNDIPATDDQIIFDFNNENNSKYASAFAHLMGPSLGIKLNNGHFFNLFTAVRAGASTHNYPYQATYYYLDSKPFYEAIPLDKADAAGMTWSEIGLNYGFSIPTYNGNLGLAITAKYLTGYEAAFAHANAPFDITQLPLDTVNVTLADVSFGFTDSNTNTNEDPQLSANGRGLGFDIGAVLTIDGTEDPYQWRLGASILDIGRINFNQNAQSHRVQLSQDTITSIPFGEFGQSDDLSDEAKLLSYHTMGDSLASNISNQFAIGLPTALSLQADYMVRPHVFVNATLVQRMKFSKKAVGRNNTLAISPRFESRWFTAALSGVLHNYRDFRMGLSTRIAFLTIGSDNLGSLFGQSTFTGSDFYVGIKINPVDWGFGELRLGGGKKGKATKCYDF